MMTKKSYQVMQHMLLMFTLLILGATFYFQYVKNLQPCPLCLMQRYSAFLLALTCLVGLRVSSLKRAKTLAIFQMTFAFLGAVFAIRQMWLQFFPAEHTSACLPGFDVLIHYFPWQDVLHALLWGAGECAEVTWKWLGLPMSVWASFYFLTMFVASGVGFILLKKSIFQSNNK